MLKIGKKEPTRAAMDSVLHSIVIQANGVLALQKVIDKDFVTAAEIIKGTNGKVIISGIGKSGYVGQKFAALLSSTGTPAFFLHPTEASHGDLGMMDDDDILILFSNSGGTTELYYIIDHAKRIGVPIISITRNNNSRIAKEADLAIELPNIEEACDIGVPTTSCTMMMVYSDALAICVYKMRGFTEADYKLLHPAGAIGYRFKTISEVMRSGDQMPLVALDEKLSEAVMEISTKRLGCAGVIDKAGVLVGIITDGDLRRVILNKAAITLDVLQIMTVDPEIFKPDELISAVINKMNHRKITNGFVVGADSKPLGAVHIHDLINFVK